jgi:hypothetical protein
MGCWASLGFQPSLPLGFQLIQGDRPRLSMPQPIVYCLHAALRVVGIALDRLFEGGIRLVAAQDAASDIASQEFGGFPAMGVAIPWGGSIDDRHSGRDGLLGVPFAPIARDIERGEGWWLRLRWAWCI